MIEWLRKNRTFNVLILICYMLLVILPHKWVGLQVTAAFAGMPRDQYNLIILIVFFVMLFLSLLFIAKRWKNHPDRLHIGAFFLATIVLIYLVNSFLFVVNVESVHYVQYAVAAMLVFPLFDNYYLTLFWTTILGVVDEAYQYFILFPEGTNYFDINDIITDFLGVCLGLLFLRTLHIEASRSDKDVLKKSLIIPLALMILVFVGLLASPVLSIHPSDDLLMLEKVIPEGFWSELPPKIIYHVVRPFEGMCYMIALFVIYYFCFRTRPVEMH